MRNAALIDICGTLFYSNTTFDFLDYYIKNPKYIRLRKRMDNKLLLIINNIIYRLFHYDYFRLRAITYLKGMRKEVIEQMADEFYQSYLLERKNTKVWQIISDLQKKNTPIVLISGTISPIAEKIAEYINCTEISSPLEYNEDICTGKIKKDNLRNKIKALNKRNIFPPYSIVITDNIADHKLFYYSEQGIAICYNNKKRWIFSLKNCNSGITYYEEQNNTFKR